MKRSKLLSAVLMPAAALFIVSLAIAVPIFVKGFYYAHVEPYHLCEYTGLSLEEIKTAYTEMLNYCIGVSSEFSTGVLAWSESGKAHFTDCRSLFILDFWVLGITTAIVLLLFFLKKKQLAAPAAVGRRHPLFFSGVGLLALFAFLGAAILRDPDGCFVTFHHIFFPGKTNWLFDPAVDQVINILPEDFFIHCAILIVGLIVGAALYLVLRFRKTVNE